MKIAIWNLISSMLTGISGGMLLSLAFTGDDTWKFILWLSLLLIGATIARALPGVPWFDEKE